ncbi:MAG: DUF6978 family protein [Candidatus Kapaibacterium sp.]
MKYFFDNNIKKIILPFAFHFYLKGRMFSNKEAEYLIGLEKEFRNPVGAIDIRKEKNRFALIAPEDDAYSFLMQITLSQKIEFKATIHHAESNVSVGLSRIDYKGGHSNPTVITDKVPSNLHRYVNKIFAPDEPHMHIYVEDYKNLVWAVPLEDTDFPIKKLNSDKDLQSAIRAFGNKINLTSDINFADTLF